MNFEEYVYFSRGNKIRQVSKFCSDIFERRVDQSIEYSKTETFTIERMTPIMQQIFFLEHCGKEFLIVYLLTEFFVRFSRANYNINVSSEPTFLKRVVEAFRVEFAILRHDLLSGFLTHPVSCALYVGQLWVSATLLCLAVRILFHIPSSIEFILRAFIIVGVAAGSKSSYLRKRELGYALAWSYYIGYLKIILPKITAAPNIFVDDGGQKHLVDGLFILIPDDCKIPGKVEEGKKIIYEGEHLTVAENMAGIVRRQYKQSVYKVYGRSGESDFYCFVEYATPLRQLYSMSTRSEKYYHETGLSGAEMRDQVNLFKHTLQELLNLYQRECFCPPKDSNLELKDFVQFVKLDDEEEEIAQAIRKGRWNMKRCK